MANNRQVLATAAEVWTTFNNSGSSVAALTGAMMRSQRWWWNQSWSGNGTPLQVLAALGEETNHSLPYVGFLVHSPAGCHTLVEENQCHQA